MPHVRQQIYEAIVALLDDATSAGSNVFAQRILPIGKNVDKVCLIFGLNEPASAISAQPVRLQRQLALRIEGHFKASAETIDDLMDDFAVAVEVAMAADRSIGGLAHESGITTTTIQHDAQGEKPVAVIRLDYTVIYHTRDTDPETSI